MSKISLRERLLGVSPEYQKFLDMNLEGREPFKGETLLADGWKYKDLPQLTEAQFRTFQEVIGPENIRWLAHSSLSHGDGSVTYRGQMFVSPDGQDRLSRYLEKN